jgi:hypothetical protein
VVQGKIDELTASARLLTDELTDANKKLTECSAYVPGFPSWATATISSILSVATLILGYFAVAGWPVIK